jgi:hypothetical protein
VPYALFPGLDGPFSPTANIEIRIDQALFHLDHAYNWQTMNFLGTTVTMIFGAWMAEWVVTTRAPMEKLKWMLVAAAAGVASSSRRGKPAAVKRGRVSGLCCQPITLRRIS